MLQRKLKDFFGSTPSIGTRWPCSHHLSMLKTIHLMIIDMTFGSFFIIPHGSGSLRLLIKRYVSTTYLNLQFTWPCFSTVTSIYCYISMNMKSWVEYHAMYIYYCGVVLMSVIECSFLPCGCCQMSKFLSFGFILWGKCSGFGQKRWES